ncbi:MAG: ABC transporter substrate-binding protein [Xanthobacteraceae bacterium]|jgi:NitT/TauT family transport system substrate-binding protein
MQDTSRRKFLKSALLTGAAAALPSSFASRALANDPVKWASLTPGFTVLVTEYIRHHKLDQKNGFKLADPIVYTSVPTYYNDFVAGSYDVCIGSWDTFATRYLAGVPIKMVCNISTAQMINIMAPKNGAKSVTELRGKTLAAPQSTGTYRIVRAVVQEYMNFNIEKEVTIQNVTNPAASVALLRAGSADAALSWEPNITKGMVEDPRLGVIFNAGQLYKEKNGHDLAYFGVAARSSLLEKNPKAAASINAVFRDCIAGILQDTAGAVAIVGERTGFDPKVLQDAISSRRLHFHFSSMQDPAERKALTAASQFFARNKLLPSAINDGFFA